MKTYFNIYIMMLLLSVLYISGCAPSMIRVPEVVAQKGEKTDFEVRAGISVPPLVTKRVPDRIEKVPEGEIEFLGGEQKITLPHDCETYRTCGVQEISFTVERYRLPLEEPFYGTRGILSIKAEDSFPFAVAQFIRGCKYSTAIEEKSGRIQRYIDWRAEEFEPVGPNGAYPVRLFMRTTPQEDSLRIFPYGSYFSRTHWYPGTKMGMAYNTAFQLRSCVYRKNDISAVPGSRVLGNVKPVICFDWESVYIYDHTSRTFEFGAYKKNNTCGGP